MPLSMYHYWERQRTIRNSSLIVFSMEVKCEETAPRVARLLLQLHHAMHKQQQVKAPTATTAPAQRERCMGSSSTDSRPSNPHFFSRKALPDGPISSGFATTSFRVVVWLGWLRLIRSLCGAAFGHCVLRGLMLIVCVRHSSRGESRAVVTTERPPLQDCRAVSRVTQNSTLHQHEYATHETPRRRPHRQPIQLGGHYSPASGARPGPSSPLAAPASARRYRPIARLDSRSCTRWPPPSGSWRRDWRRELMFLRPHRISPSSGSSPLLLPRCWTTPRQGR